PLIDPLSFPTRRSSDLTDHGPGPLTSASGRLTAAKKCQTPARHHSRGGCIWLTLRRPRVASGRRRSLSCPRFRGVHEARLMILRSEEHTSELQSRENLV